MLCLKVEKLGLRKSFFLKESINTSWLHGEGGVRFPRSSPFYFKIKSLSRGAVHINRSTQFIYLKSHFGDNKCRKNDNFSHFEYINVIHGINTVTNAGFCCDGWRHLHPLGPCSNPTQSRLSSYYILTFRTSKWWLYWPPWRHRRSPQLPIGSKENHFRWTRVCVKMDFHLSLKSRDSSKTSRVAMRTWISLRFVRL